MTDSPVRHEFRRNATVRRRSINSRCQSISSHWRPINSPSRIPVYNSARTAKARSEYHFVAAVRMEATDSGSNTVTCSRASCRALNNHPNRAARSVAMSESIWA
jgi:hypothetical protein